MTDRELLERAALAAGMNVGTDEGGYDDLKWWNPLTNDGDAFRLAVKLRFDICTEDNDWSPTEDRHISHVNVWPFGGGAGVSEELEPDPFAATRRAIVLAAARLGEKL
jgi:hypothetical protein